MSIQAIHVRNPFKGEVCEIIGGDVVSETDVETRSVDNLRLAVGSGVVFE